MKYEKYVELHTMWTTKNIVNTMSIYLDQVIPVKTNKTPTIGNLYMLKQMLHTFLYEKDIELMAYEATFPLEEVDLYKGQIVQLLRYSEHFTVLLSGKQMVCLATPYFFTWFEEVM
jgi:hypothetical protein